MSDAIGDAMSLADINFGIQNAASTKSTAQYVRFNQIFAD
jgi:hypothetical protein